MTRDVLGLAFTVAPAAVVVILLALPSLWRRRQRRRAVRHIKPFLGDCIPPGTDEDRATFERHEIWRREMSG